MNAGTSQIRILAVDDHPIVRQGIAGLIGIQTDMILVGEASNGRDAIQQFRTHHPDVTLMDLQMPEMNGIDALTPAEILVLRMIAAGNANKQIADQLSITEETVKSRVKNILSKLGANDRTHAAMIGLKRGIIEL